MDLQTEGETTVHKSKRSEFAGPYYIDSISNYCDNEKKKIGSTEDLYPLYGTDRVNVPKAIPTRDGYTFIGWKQTNRTKPISVEQIETGFQDKFYYDGGWSDGTGDYASEVVPDYQTYNAEWDENDVTISYHAKENGKIVITGALAAGEGSESETETFKDVTGKAAGATAIPDEGYHFTEWKVVKRASDDKENVQVSEDATLNFDKVAENATRARKGEGSVKYTPVYYATTFEAYFAPNTYTVKFNSNSPDATGEMEDQAYTFGIARELNGNSFSRSHYEFIGWALNSDETEATYKDKASFVIDADNINSLNIGANNTVTLYAVWKETASATITYVLNGRNEAGKIKADNPSGNKEIYWPGVDSFAFEEPTYKVIPTDGSAEKKYVFEGWYTDPTFKEGTKKTGITPVDRGNITVYAKWRAVGRVRYYLDTEVANWNLEADSDRIIPETPGNRKNFIDITDNYTDGSDKTLTGVRSFTVPSNAPTRTGYRFDGWTHSAIDGGNPVMAGSGSYDFPYAGDYDPDKSGTPDRVTFHAKWTPYTYSVIFDENLDGTAGGSDRKESQSFTYDKSASLNLAGGEGAMTPVVTYTRPGYKFMGWATTPDADAAQYQNKAAVSNWTIGGGEIVWPKNGSGTVAENAQLTLYAVWKSDFSVTVTGFHKVYDGNRYSVEVTGTVPGDQVTYSYTSNGVSKTVGNPVSAKDVNESIGEVKVTVTRGGEVYTETVDAVIEKRPVQLKSAGKIKEFDGKVLRLHELELDGSSAKADEGWVKGEGLDESQTIFFGEITFPGTAENMFDYTLSGSTKADNYAIDVDYGKLVVTDRKTPYEITVVADSETVKYDGTEHTLNRFKELRYTVDGEEKASALLTTNGQLEFMLEDCVYVILGLEAHASGTDAGIYTVEITGEPQIYTKADRGEVTRQFSVKKIFGTLTITPRSVVLTSQNDEKEYDGKPLTCEQVKVSGDGFVGNDGVDYSFTGSQTLVGSSENTFDYTLKEGVTPKNYSITTKNGTLTVRDRTEKYPITVQANSGAYTYDGKEKTVSGFESLTFMVNGETYTVSGLTASGSGKDVAEGGYPVEVTGTPRVTDRNGNDVTAQFAVTLRAGRLTINKRPVKLRSADKTKQYDGGALVNGDTELELNEGWVEGEGISSYSFTGRQREVGSSPNKFTYTLKENTKPDNYEITKEEGTLTVINRREGEKYRITVRAKSRTFLYDGKDKTVYGFETLSFHVDGHDYTVTGLTASGEGKNAGTYTVQVAGRESMKVLSASGADETAQFDVTIVEGSLTIGKRSVKLESASLAKTYDGLPLENGDVALAKDGKQDVQFSDEGKGWADGEGAEITFTGSQTLVGSSANSFDYKLKMDTLADNYVIEKTEGTLTVTDRVQKFRIEVQARSASFKYNGLPQTVSGFTRELTYQVNGQTYTLEGLTAQASATDAGTYPVKVQGTPIVKDAAGNDVTAQFDVQKEDGMLEITRRKVILRSGSATKKYDGDWEPLTDPTLELSGDGFVEGEAEARTTGVLTYVGKTPNMIKIEKGDTYKDGNYDITMEEGTLRVTDGAEDDPVEPTLVVTKTHDGQQYRVGEKIVFTITATNIYNVRKTVTLKEQAGAAFEAGTSGAAIGPDGKTAVFENVEPGASVTITAVCTVTEEDVRTGRFTNKVTVEFSGEEKHFTGSDTVEIDRDCVYTVKFVNQEDSRELRDPLGPVTVKYGTQITENTRNTQGTAYKDILIRGYAYVKSSEPLTVTTNSAENVLILYYKPDFSDIRAVGFDVVYDGNRHRVGVTGTILPDDEITYSYVVNGAEKTVKTPVSAKNVDESVREVKVTVTRGEESCTRTVEAVIRKREVVLQSASLEKEFDGEALANGDVPLRLDGHADDTEQLGREEGWVDGEGFFEDRLFFTEERIWPGSSPNAFLFEEDSALFDNTDKDNYDIVSASGTLTVRERETPYKILIEANSDTVTYDGTEQKVVGFADVRLAAGETGTLSWMRSGDSLLIVLDDYAYVLEGIEALCSGTNAGDYVVEIEGTPQIHAKIGWADMTSQFEIEFVPGKLTIEPRPVTLTSGSARKKYDGYELTYHYAEADGFVGTDGAEYEFTGSQTVVGSSPNRFTYKLKEGTLPGNYAVETEEGILTVDNLEQGERLTILARAKSGTCKYDGTEHEVSGFVREDLKYEIKGQTYTVEGLSAKAVGMKAGTYEVKVTGTAVVKDAEGNDVTDQFDVITRDGRLTVNKRKVILKSGSAAKKYDGDPLQDPSLDIGGDGFVEGEAAPQAVGSITYVGSASNTIELNPKTGYSEGNYELEILEGILKVTDGTATNPLAPSFVATKTHGNSTKMYRVGDRVNFTLEATNIYNEPKTITLTELEGVTFVAGTSGAALKDGGRIAVFENVEPGANVWIEAVYTITDADVREGNFANEAAVNFSGVEKSFKAKDVVDRIDRSCEYVVKFVEASGRAAGSLRELHEQIGPVAANYGMSVDGDTIAENGRPYNEVEIAGYKYAGTSGPLTVTTNTENNVLYVYYRTELSNLDATGFSCVYDGTETQVTVSGTLDDDVVTYTYKVVENGSVSEYTTDAPVLVKNVKDSIGEVTVTVTRGSVSWSKTVEAIVTPRKVTLQSADLSKKYDGQPLVNGNTPLVLDGVADSGETIPEDEGWAQGDSVSYSFTGRQIEVGTSENSFEVVAGEGTDLSNYAIEKREGKLTVTAADPVQAESQKQAETETKKPSEPETEKTKTGAKLTVTKSIISGDDGHLLGLDEAKFYVALFKDAKMTELAGEIRELDFDLNTAIASVTYRNLKPGTYYVAEVNAKGKVVSSGKYGGGIYAANYKGDAQKVTIGKDDRSVKFAFENRFLKLPKAQYYRDLGLPKDSKNGNNKNGNSKSRPEDEQQTEPESGGQANGTGAVGAGTEAAKTGDGTPIEWMLLLLAASGMLLILTEERRRRSRS